MINDWAIGKPKSELTMQSLKKLEAQNHTRRDTTEKNLKIGVEPVKKSHGMQFLT